MTKPYLPPLVKNLVIDQPNRKKDPFQSVHQRNLNKVKHHEKNEEITEKRLALNRSSIKYHNEKDAIHRANEKVALQKYSEKRRLLNVI